MEAKHLQRRSVSLDCDTIYWADILGQIREMPAKHGAVFWFPDDGNKPIFSYIKTEEKGSISLITDIQEKKAISNKANTGAYVFSTAQTLRTWAARNIDANASKSRGSEIGEYYTSQMIATMIVDGKLPFIGMPITKKDFSCVGTPDQLQDLLLQLKDKENVIRVKKRRFCFDLDMTLVGVPEISGDYSTCPPIWKNIELVQQLHKAGHHIIIVSHNYIRLLNHGYR
jgi:hypothetical protein